MTLREVQVAKRTFLVCRSCWFPSALQVGKQTLFDKIFANKTLQKGDSDEENKM